MTLKEQLLSAQKDAMKAKDSETLSTLRMVWSAVKNEEIKAQEELNDAKVQEVIAKQVKQLKDATKDFAAGGRDDLVESTNKEVAILEAYLPEQMSDEDLKKIVDETVAGFGEVSPADMGKLMGAVMGKVKGQADGNRVKEMVSAVLKG
jgi:uncharacterized protein